MFRVAHSGVGATIALAAERAAECLGPRLASGAIVAGQGRCPWRMSRPVAFAALPPGG